MNGIKFIVKGQTAFFKKPDVNSFVYFTYSQIHKVALMGILGAIIGLKGYSQQKDEVYPEYYNLLKDLKIAIVPLAKDGALPGLCSKKVQVFNNSVGYASKEAGGNLITKEQWLENPMWEIYIKDDGQCYFNKIKAYLLEQKCEYIPYLGKNDHFATIEDVEEVLFEEIQGPCVVNSLCLKNRMTICENEIELDLETEEEEETYFKYEEKLPVGLEKQHNQYCVERFILTNKLLCCNEEDGLYRVKDKIISFI